MARQSSSIATIASGQTDSDVVNFGLWNTGTIIAPTLTGTSLKFKVSDAAHAGHVILQTAAGADVIVPSTGTIGANKAYPLPAELAGCKSFIIVSQAAEGAVRSIKISRKG